MPPSNTALTRARDFVAQVVPDDISEATAEEDLRDYGLDSVRAIDLIALVNAAGGELGFPDLAGGPTLTIIASALEASDPEGPR
ncbi:phosphopantetheine-binding protein [Devriesea agamarum]|uniref:phosphopantetheine-binding protein n=1 Tax=Devriesea agamarum TaxID=472569 RepID=UPI00071D0C67|nr:phosphopantetheine-binding protein [Devriesea agamarum]